jgi:hypothetical protein
MPNISRCRSLLAVPLILVLNAPVFAQNPYEWAEKMFDSTSHDFGAVARGADVQHRFKVTNLYKEDVQISNVTASCGCTSPRFNNTPIKTGESTYVDVTMDTNKFQHEKSSTVTVTFAQPQFATITIPVKVYIRTDVVLTPGSINFGAVDLGAGQERKVELTYAGDPNWAITKVVTNNDYLKAQVKETMRQNGQVGYDLIVGLSPKAPVGYLRQQIMLSTNDQAGQIPVLVEGRIESDVTVTPNVVQLGSVTPGTAKVQTVILRGNKPFIIEKVECDSAHGLFKMPKLTQESKAVHVIALTFMAPKESGPVAEKFIVTIAGRKDPVSFTAQGTIETAQQVTP